MLFFLLVSSAMTFMAIEKENSTSNGLGNFRKQDCVIPHYHQFSQLDPMRRCAPDESQSQNGMTESSVQEAKSVNCTFVPIGPAQRFRDLRVRIPHSESRHFTVKGFILPGTVSRTTEYLCHQSQSSLVIDDQD